MFTPLAIGICAIYASTLFATREFYLVNVCVVQFLCIVHLQRTVKDLGHIVKLY